MDYVKRAEEIAEEAHAGQFRRDGVTPYIEHPRAVVSRVVSRMRNNPKARSVEWLNDAVAVAWLHDTIEDAREIAEPLIEQDMPPEVVEAVRLLTKRKGIDYLDFVKGTKENDIAREVKRADILSNLADAPTDEQIRKYAKALLDLFPEE